MPERTHEDAASDPDTIDAFIKRTYGRVAGDDLAGHPPAAPHLLIRASAGTGKTYRLTTRYLRLLRAGETAEHILATTFTRKAAGEVLGRVLGWLARASVDPRERAGLDFALGGFGLSEQECLVMLRRLVDGLNRLAIGTIDSFFNRAARALRFELDLPAEPRLTDEHHPAARELRYDAIQRVLGEAAATDDGFQTLIELLRRVHHDTADRSVTEAIDALVVELHDVYRQHDDRALWAKLDPPPVLSRELLNTAVMDVVALGEHIPATKTGAPRKHWATAYQTISLAAQRHDFDAILGHEIAKRLLEAGDGAVYSGCEIPALWQAALTPILKHARAQTLQQLAQMTESTYDLLDAFSSQYEDAKRAAGVLLFSDLTHLLSRAMPTLGEDVAEQFYYRLDSRVTHLLLDEFQDTSLPQWRVLEPFALEVTAAADGGRSFFCVGDEKQAIYGWRGGCAELFSAVEELPGVTPWTMTQSRRSSPVVLDTVNQVFSTLTTNVAFEDKHDRWAGAAEHWAARFETHAAHDTTLPGHVLLKTTAPSDSDAAYDADDDGDGDTGAASPHEVYCAEHIARVAIETPGTTVGVLLRRKKAARGLLHRLRALGVAVSEEGGNPIDHTPAVGAVLSAIQLADHPGDTVAAFHVGNSPLGGVLGMDWRDKASVGSAALRIRRAVLDRGYGETVALWCRAVAPSCDARSLRRLEQLVGLAQQYDHDMAGAVRGGGALRVSGFVEVVRRARVESPTPAAVRVMTLHAAKGLEFDTVVLPDLHATLSANDHNALVMLDRDSPLDAPRRIVRRLKRGKLAAIGLEKLADREDAWQRGEDLCLLYVGMTRAKHALHLLVPPLKATKTGLSSVGRTNLSYAAILRQALAPDFDETAEGGEVLYEHGDVGWAAALPGMASESSDEAPGSLVEPRGTITLVPERRPTRGLPERRPSDGAEDTRVHATDLLKLSASGGRGYGSAMHAVCELLGFVDEETLPGDDVVADALRRAGQPDGSEDVAAFAGRLRGMLKAEPVRSVLSREGAAELWRERGFAVVLDGRLVRGVYDRVHVWRDAAGKATRARLIDFKTDRLPDAGPDALAEHYGGQVNAYRAALCAMLGIQPDAVEAMLVLTGDAVVIPVDGPPD
ncbi:UvrD-helicase domain-containing protein [Phycisphaeraceae bacterium D3-23]